ncbi:DUF4386 family protein [Pengzhenrongella frigida]|uniref:DUF4386 family protein n=1 Tax=Pengzhenrongella frigida TaxID=1259133 RepID=A0A4Q5N3H2_9MICO|nr:DUF4386 family protein [Cellulomonas sp. HLT2-17]RYV52782.1 DUF4386 family protein [Cellulomonas sp. HLT2-17]
MNVEVSSRPARVGGGPDPSWRRLYVIGAASAWIFVGLLIAAIVLSIVTPPPPTAQGTATLDYIAAHRTLYVVHQQLWLVPGVFAMVTYLSLYPALKHLDRSTAAVGTVVGASAWALTLAIPTSSTGAPALVYLSDQYMATADAARRASLTAAAETLIAQNRTPGVVGVLTTVGLLIVSVVMLRGVFPRAVAFLGIVVGVLGIASEALRPVIEGAYGIYGVLMLVWMAAVGWSLVRLGSNGGRSTAT